MINTNDFNAFNDIFDDGRIPTEVNYESDSGDAVNERG